MEKLPEGQLTENIPDDELIYLLASIVCKFETDKLNLRQAGFRALRATVTAIHDHPELAETIIMDLAAVGHSLNPPVEKLARRYLPEEKATKLSACFPPQDPSLQE